jgi:hydroxyacylglutathione hydrolase
VVEVKEALWKYHPYSTPGLPFSLHKGFVPGSIFIGLEGRFAEWAGSLLPFNQPIILVTEGGNERETIVRLARVGFSKVTGYLQGGFEAWVGCR